MTIRMNIRIMYGRFKYKIKKWFEFNRIRKALYAIKTLDLEFSSFFELIFKPKVMYVLDFSNVSNYYPDDLLKKIAALKYIYNYPVFIMNEDCLGNGVDSKKLINKYYLKLLNGGQK